MSKDDLLEKLGTVLARILYWSMRVKEMGFWPSMIASFCLGYLLAMWMVGRILVRWLLS